MSNNQEVINSIYDITNVLSGVYKEAEYKDLILPMCVLRRLDCVLESSKDCNFSNASGLSFNKLLSNPNDIASNFKRYIDSFSENVKDVISCFDFHNEIDKLSKNNILHLVIEKFSKIDLHPEVVSNFDMGLIFESLIRKFLGDTDLGEYYTPEEVIKLMVQILFLEDSDILTKQNIVKTIYDPCVGTGRMGLVAKEYLRKINPSIQLNFFGQEINFQSYAICKADMLINGENPDNIKLGNTLSQDAFSDYKFDYMISNPPYGVDWSSIEGAVLQDYRLRKRFKAGIPRKTDGQLLFVQHLVSKMKDEGSRIAIITSNSPLFAGDVEKGESKIRRWLIENDLIEGIISLPPNLFYNTCIATYIWILTNKKSQARKGKIQLINASNFYERMDKSLGDKRNYITEKQIEEIVKIYSDFKENEYCKIFNNDDFGYRKVTIEGPSKLSFNVDIPLKEDINKYFEKQIKPRIPNAWINQSKTRIGYRINFQQYFYNYTSLRSLEEIDKDILELIPNIKKLLSLLDEKKQAIITEAITKGLNPNVKMKDSGIEWIGKIPEHWEIKPLKYFLLKENNIRHTVEGSAKVIKQSHIHWDGIKLDNIELSDKFVLSKKLMKGDLLLNSTGARTLGRASLFYEDGDFFAGEKVFIIRLNKDLLNEVFAFYLIQSKIYQDFLYSLSTGATDKIQIYPKDIHPMPIIVPPIAEQKEIANYLKAKDQYFKHVKDNIETLDKIVKLCYNIVN